MVLIYTLYIQSEVRDRSYPHFDGVYPQWLGRNVNSCG